MIKYRLVCANGHAFDGWFRDSSAYDVQAEKRLLTCPECGSTDVSKGLMAPNIATSGAIASKSGTAQSADLPPAELMSRMQALARKLRKSVEENFDYVGDRFPEEVRQIHYGEAEDRGVYGEAGAEDVRELLDEGIAILPLPDLPENAN